MKFWGWVSLSWLACFVAAINFSTMYARPAYSASWTKVAIFAAFAILYAHLAKSAKDKP